MIYAQILHYFEVRTKVCFKNTHLFERYYFDDVGEVLYGRLESDFHFELARRVVELKNVKISVITNGKTI